MTDGNDRPEVDRREGDRSDPEFRDEGPGGEHMATVEVDRPPRRERDPATCRLLLTNDDGLDAPGLQHLARALGDSYRVVVAAPSEDVSGAGTSIGRYDLDDRTRVWRRDLDGLEAYAFDGPPGLAVMAAALGAFGDPFDLVVSGINAGMNTGTSIVHSGTVGAAITARTFGIDGLAVSLAEGERWEWETAVEVARGAAAWVLGRDEPTTLNVNVPGRPLDQVRGTSWAAIDTFGHFHVAAVDAEGEALDLEVRDRSSGSDPRSDSARCLAGWVTCTLLGPLAAEPVPAGVDAADVTGRR